MAWVAAIIVLILLVVSAGFRQFALVLILICVIGGFAFYQYEQQEEKRSKTRIPISEIEIEGLTLKPSYSSYDLTGRIKNNSNQYTLSGLQMNLTFRDCEIENENNCIIVAEEDEYIYTNIPPKQARDFTEGIYLYSDMKIKGKMVWSYDIAYTKAK